MRRLAFLFALPLLSLGCGSAPELPDESLDGDGGTDAVTSDTGVGADTGVGTDTGVVTTDTGVISTDTGVISTDTGVISTDTGVISTDTGTPCTTVSDGKYYVDPVAGDDTTGTGATGCALKTITRAVAILNALSGGAPAGATIFLRNNAGPAETFPIVVPANVTVRSESTAAIRTVEIATGKTGFSLQNPNSGLTYLNLDGKGNGNSGVNVSGAASSSTTTLTFVGITAMRNDGINVESGGLRIGPAVRSNGNGTSATAGLGSGLHVRGTVVISVAAGEAFTSFDSNAANGILIEGAGSVTATGKPDLTGFPGSTPPAVSAGTGTITVRQNELAGIGIVQSGTSSTPAFNSFTGIVVWKNVGNGIRIYSGSRLVLRDSVAAQNGRNGFEVSPTSTSTSITGIDLGGDGFGRNLFSANTSAGICVDNFGGSTVTLPAKGNLFGTKSCAVTPAPFPLPTVTVASANADCSGVGPIDVGAERGTGGSTPTKVTVSLANCTDAIWP